VIVNYVFTLFSDLVFSSTSFPVGVLASTLGLNSITAFLFFTVLYYLFDNRLWNSTLLQRFHQIPDLSGDWSGKINVEGENGKDDVSVHIEQTWTKLELTLKLDNGQAISDSKTASITTNSGETRLVITYLSRQQGPGMGERDHHEGVNWFNHDPTSSPERLYGRYFTDPSRGSQGLIKLEKEV
jgi:hypothetical protein